MKDKNGVIVEVGDRVRFSWVGGNTLDKVGKVEDIVDDCAYIWAVGDLNSLSPWKRSFVEVIK